ncbi:hypothetical protein B5V02_10785 [Mesorhizobium kowhaii]|uniref:Uncharacterized protein n=1 Tax=Mesorhizobium kowhaii TaxID=1300272 RepID=A0A2W7C886_9HYPH|nr:hypothetical protein B5V02_10785 [Mesorhizobium kowhaii]
MTTKLTFRNCAVLALALATFVQVDPVSLVTQGSISSEALARVGHPLTPRSVAGVGRRTTRRTVRRTIRRTSVYVARLPAGCVRTSVNGTSVWHCGGRYYQHAGSRYVVVQVN